MKKPIIYKFRIHTRKYDADGELCLIHIGGRLIPDPPKHVWLTGPLGNKIYRAELKDVEPVSDAELAENLRHEIQLNRNRQKRASN